MECYGKWESRHSPELRCCLTYRHHFLLCIKQFSSLLIIILSYQGVNLKGVYSTAHVSPSSLGHNSLDMPVSTTAHLLAEVDTSDCTSTQHDLYVLKGLTYVEPIVFHQDTTRPSEPKWHLYSHQFWSCWCDRPRSFCLCDFQACCPTSCRIPAYRYA